MVRGFLATVGVAYLALALYCGVLPRRTSRAVGFDLRPGVGQSEYLVIYTGLELALGLFFLAPLFTQRVDLATTLFFAVILHGCLVGFRTASLFLYSGLERQTYVLAAVEWAIFLGALACWWRQPTA